MKLETWMAKKMNTGIEVYKKTSWMSRAIDYLEVAKEFTENEETKKMFDELIDKIYTDIRVVEGLE